MTSQLSSQLSGRSRFDAALGSASVNSWVLGDPLR